jgi:hypothetical protein
MLKITVAQPFAVHPMSRKSASKDRQGVLYCQGVEARCKVMTWLSMLSLAPSVVSAGFWLHFVTCDMWKLEWNSFKSVNPF